MMRQQQVEAQVLRIVEMVLGGQNVEDDRVELKSDWPVSFPKTARQLAGHANAAGGEPILWIIGIDEAGRRVNDVTPTEVQAWWSRVERRFDGVAPDLETLVVPTPSGKSVVGLRFDTSRSPYIVTTDGNGPEREVPWRSGNNTRSARRSEILRSVVGEAEVPQLELISATCVFRTEKPWMPDLEPHEVPTNIRYFATVRCYLEAREQATLPEHKWSAVMKVRDQMIPVRFTVIGPRAPVGSYESGGTRYEDRGRVTYVTGSGLEVRGSEAITVNIDASFEGTAMKPVFAAAKRIDLTLNFPVSLSSRSANLSVALRRAKMSIDEDQRVDPRIAEFTHNGQQLPARRR